MPQGLPRPPAGCAAAGSPCWHTKHLPCPRVARKKVQWREALRYCRGVLPALLANSSLGAALVQGKQRSEHMSRQLHCFERPSFPDSSLPYGLAGSTASTREIMWRRVLLTHCPCPAGSLLVGSCHRPSRQGMCCHASRPQFYLRIIKIQVDNQVDNHTARNSHACLLPSQAGTIPFHSCSAAVCLILM